MAESNPRLIPQRGHPDRKRALNVLAQRRYRARKRERVAELERRAGQPAVLPVAPVNVNWLTDHSPIPFMQTSTFGDDDAAAATFFDWPTPSSLLEVGTADAELVAPPNPVYHDILMDCPGERITVPAEGAEYEGGFPALQGDSGQVFEELLGNESDALIGTELSNLEVSQFTFPDDASLEIPALQVLRVGLRIAQAMGCAETIWDPTATRLFDGSGTRVMDLPRNMWPTQVQARIRHHPLIDVLPWPSVREKMILILEQPLQLRPPAARDPNAITNMMIDIDDPTEGFRILGPNSMDGSAWEVGQAFFRNWWWGFDRVTVRQTNSLRAARGLLALSAAPIEEIQD